MARSWPLQTGEAGYESGKNAKIEYRWAENQYDRLPSMAADFVRDQVAVIAALGTPAARAAKGATATIPIAFTTIADPAQMGFVASLNRPGGNLTGVTLLAVEVGPKLLEILRGVVPSATTIALLVNPTNPNSETQSKNTQEAARKLGIELHVLNASVERDFDTVFEKLREVKASALIIGQDLYFNAESARLAALTVRNAIPVIYPLPEFAAAGGLFSYGALSTWKSSLALGQTHRNDRGRPGPALRWPRATPGGVPQCKVATGSEVSLRR
jgi:putative tryptophan/tyrosine transport system substrate-binding protein